MSNILLAEEEEATGKVNIDELYEKNMRRDLKQLSIFNKILNRVHKRIQTISKIKKNDKHIWFTVPEFLFGEPAYDQGECVAYLVSKLVDNGFSVRYIHPHTLFVSWEHWIPSYVRNEVKKKTGKIINEKGQVVGDTKEDAGAEPTDPNARMLQGTQGATGAAAKQYTPIGQYKPAGMIYNPDIFEKLEKRITFTPSRIANARGNVTLPLESPHSGAI
jgi:hypothetical protein